MFAALRLNIYVVLCLPFTEDRKMVKTVQKLFQQNVVHCWSYYLKLFAMHNNTATMHDGKLTVRQTHVIFNFHNNAILYTYPKQSYVIYYNTPRSCLSMKTSNTTLNRYIL